MLFATMMMTIKMMMRKKMMRMMMITMLVCRSSSLSSLGSLSVQVTSSSLNALHIQISSPATSSFSQILCLFHMVDISPAAARPHRPVGPLPHLCCFQLPAPPKISKPPAWKPAADFQLPRGSSSTFHSFSRSGIASKTLPSLAVTHPQALQP